MEMIMHPHMQMEMSLFQNSNWSLVKAFQNDHGGGGKPPLKIGFRYLRRLRTKPHSVQMKLIDEHNKLFRFAYVGSMEDESAGGSNYYKIPLLRDRNVEIDDIKIRITQGEYDRASMILESVGGMQRIARAIPYHGLLTSVTCHLKKEYGVSLDDIVIVGVDRGGRLPAMILARALDRSQLFFLKVDQGNAQLDEDSLRGFASQGTFRDRHVLFVDSTVDSGRQINVLRRYLDHAIWQKSLGHRSWSIVGSNEYGKSLDKHMNINWGVDPDITFEDNPLLMGVNYASGSHTKVIEVPSETSTRIRQVLMSVPDGSICDLMNIADKMKEYRQNQRKIERTQIAIENQWRHIVSLSSWQYLKQSNTLPSRMGYLPESLPESQGNVRHKILFIGYGGKVDIPQEHAGFIADTLGPYNSFLVGTQHGNPGEAIRAIFKRDQMADVRLYRPGYERGDWSNSDGSFVNARVVFAGKDKNEMRWQMVNDSDIVLVLGGAEGTLLETLTAMHSGKQIFFINNWGAVNKYIRNRTYFRGFPNFHVNETLVEAINAIVNVNLDNHDQCSK